MDGLNLKKIKYLLILFLIIFFSIVGFIRISYDLNIIKKEIKDKDKIINKQIEILYKSSLNRINKSLYARVKYLTKAKPVIEALIKKNPKILKRVVDTRFNIMKKSIPTLFNIRVFTKDGKPFYSYLDLKKRNLPINPKIIEYITKIKKELKGFTFTNNLYFKMILPIKKNNQIIGYMGMSVKMDFLYNMIKKSAREILELEIEPKIFINKNILAKRYNKNSLIIINDYAIMKNKKNELFYNVSKIIDNKKYIKIENNTYYISYNKKHWHLVKSKLNIKDFKNNTLGKLFYLIDTTKLQRTRMDKMYNAIKYPIIILVFVVIIIFLMFNFFNNKIIQLYDRTKKILNSQDNLIVITDGKKMVECNQSVLNFLGYKTFNDFIKEYSCICDFFKTKPNKNFLQKEVNGQNWSDYIIKHQDKVHRVLMVDKNKKEHIFEVKGKEFSQKQGKVIRIFTFNDITLLEIEREKTNKQDRILFEQSKMAAMGEMIGNIAHQWRQPLSIISTIATSLKLKKELNMLDNDELIKSLDNINDSVQYLSKTIDDFRNFFAPNKKIEKYKILKVLKQTINITSATFKNNNISLITDFKDTQIESKGYPNEIIQALINIINNAKDAIKGNNIENRYIFINTYLQDKYYVIKILDSGGGIPENIINRIFEPYFTTKHKSRGTGIGLYMTHQILTEHIPGKIEVTNKEYEYDGYKLKGAEFIIKIPLNL